MVSVTNPGPAPSWAQPPAPAQQAPPVETLESRLSRWYVLRDQIAALTAQEGELRREIAAQAFPGAPERGSVRRGIGHGKDVKLTAKVNYSVDRGKLAALGGNALPDSVRDAVFRYKPEVVEAAFLAATAPTADPAVRAVLCDVVTSRPGMPGLEIVDSVKGRG